MPKKIFAVTNVKIGNEQGQFFAAGTEVDGSKFSKEQLLELHEQGAIEVRVVDEGAKNPVTDDSEAAPVSEGATPDTSDKDSEGSPVKEDVNPGPGTEPVE